MTSATQLPSAPPYSPPTEHSPIFAADIGVRLSPSVPAEDSFYPVFNAGEAAAFDTRRGVSFFVSDASDGVARLLLSDRFDPVTQPAGRLLRVVTVPIDKQEKWLNVEFRLDRHLSLQVRATGRLAQANIPPTVIHQIPLGFPMPQVSTAPLRSPSLAGCRRRYRTCAGSELGSPRLLKGVPSPFSHRAA